MSIVDGEVCCRRPGALLARARQAKGRAQNAAKRSGGQASRPPVAARFRALEGPVLIDSPSHDDSDFDALEQVEAKAILDQASNTRNGARWSVAFALGLRQAEALGMRWKCLDAWTSGEFKCGS